MTWAELAVQIADMSEEQRQEDILVHVQSEGEYYGGDNVLLCNTSEDSFYLDVDNG